ncbi:MULTISPECIES: hypothetical protein [unclassified Paraburkholderia]|uniref:hypothetical protein n=1 Tax=unclassified Paraburkholderia TaxID=2615204 RepID=UPI002AB7045B|nr:MULTISPECIES: hypothetical protein [unclassified Paraburkholderia]
MQQTPTISAVSLSTAPRVSHEFDEAPLFHLCRAPFSACDRCGALHWIQRGENMSDFFGIEDLLSQAYEDAVYNAMIPA